MPVRSRGHLLSGMAIVLSLSTIGVGCHSAPQPTTVTDSFALHGENEHHSGLIGRLFHRSDRTTPSEGMVVPMETAASYPSTQMYGPTRQVYAAGAVAPRTVVVPPAVSTTVPPQQPRIYAPAVPAASPSGVIASSWQPVQHVAFRGASDGS